MPNVPLSQHLPAEHIVVPLQASSFTDALTELVGRLVEQGGVRDVAALDHALSSPRGRDVVSIGRDVALPHIRTDAVARLLVALGVARAPLEPGGSGLDVAPRILALVLAPPEAATLYLQTVAALARFFSSPHVVARLYAARTAGDIVALPEFAAVKIRPELTVRDMMVHDAATVAPDTKTRDAVDIMVQRRLRALPVVGDKGEVLGIVTEWDVMRALLPHIPRAGEPPAADEENDESTVREVMTRSVLCISEEMSIEEAVNLMLNKRVEQCPVVREGVFTGILTRSNIIRKLFGR